MLKKLRFFIPILFFLFMWLPLWADKSIKQLTTSGLATRAPALAIPEWKYLNQMKYLNTVCKNKGEKDDLNKQ